MQLRSDGLPESRLLRAGGFASGVLLLFPIVYVGLDVAFASTLHVLGLGEPSASLSVPRVETVAVTSFSVLGPAALLSAVSVIGRSLYGEAWLETDSTLALAFRAGGLALTTVGGTMILLGLLWAFLQEALETTSTFAIAASLLVFVAIVWIVGRSARSFLAGYRAPE